MSLNSRFSAKIAFASLLIFSNFSEAAEIYVSPQGASNSAGGCTQSVPCSLTAAQAAVRSMNQNMTSDINVFITDGIYELNEPLTFGPSDSGFNGHFVHYQAVPNTSPVLSGGTVISNWVPIANSTVYKATVENMGANFDIRQIYVNGTRAPRARSGPVSVTNRRVVDYSVLLDIDVLDMRSGPNIDSIELVSSKDWTNHRCQLSGIQPESSSTIKLKNPCGGKFQELRVGEIFWLENSKKFFDSAGPNSGQWYFDKSTKTIYYSPLPGMDINAARIVAAGRTTGNNLGQLIVGSGSLGDGVNTSYVKNLKFSGLTFAYTTWLKPNTGSGFIETQAGIHARDCTGLTQEECSPLDLERIQAAVSFKVAKNIDFSGNQFLHIGGGGLNIESGSSDISILGNTFSDLSGGAIVAGDLPTKSDPNPAKTSKITISNNYIEQIGAEYHGAVAILFMYGEDSTISNNEISNTPYSGISLGWQWDNDPTYSKNNTVKSNYIHDIAQVMRDGGAIYTLGSQPGSIISYNHIKNVGPAANANCADYMTFTGYVGIYHDQGSRYFTDSNNFIENNVCVYWVLLQGEGLKGSLNNQIQNSYVEVDMAWCNAHAQNAVLNGGDFNCRDPNGDGDANSFSNISVLNKITPPEAQAAARAAAGQIAAAAGIVDSSSYPNVKSVKQGPLYDLPIAFDVQLSLDKTQVSGPGTVVATSKVVGDGATCTASTSPNTNWNAVFNMAAGQSGNSSPIDITATTTFTLSCVSNTAHKTISKSVTVTYVPTFNVQLSLDKTQVIGSGSVVATSGVVGEGATCNASTSPGTDWNASFSLSAGQSGSSSSIKITAPTRFTLTCVSNITHTTLTKSVNVAFSP